MADFGVNIDWRNPTGRPTATQLYPFRWVRVVLREDLELRSYLQSLKEAGIAVIGVLDKDSFGSVSSTVSGFHHREISRLYAYHLAEQVSVWQIGNEEDVYSPSSWTMESGKYVKFFNNAAGGIRKESPRATIILGGLASGLTDYLDRIKGAVDCDGIGIHPYGQRPSPDFPAPHWGYGDLSDLLARYIACAQPLYVTEYGVSERDLPGPDEPARQAEYLVRFSCVLDKEPSVKVAVIFCWSDGMIPGMGLVDDQGNPKAAHGAMQKLLEAKKTAPEVVMPEFRSGFKTFAEEHPEVGQPSMDEVRIAPGVAMQMTSAGVLWFCQAAANAGNPPIRFSPDPTVR